MQLLGLMALAGINRLKLDLHYEVMCGECQNFIQGTLSPVLSLPGAYKYVDLNLVPWGNTYYAVEGCSSDWLLYDMDNRHCWTDYCNRKREGTELVGFLEDSSCSDGVKICQHDEEECVANRISGCAIDVYPDPADYFPFVDCVDKQPDTRNDPMAASKGCAAETGLKWQQIEECLNTRGEEIDTKFAAISNSWNGSDSVAHECEFKSLVVFS
jgi:hypothetical protein